MPATKDSTACEKRYGCTLDSVTKMTLPTHRKHIDNPPHQFLEMNTETVSELHQSLRRIFGDEADEVIQTRLEDHNYELLFVSEFPRISHSPPKNTVLQGCVI